MKIMLITTKMSTENLTVDMAAAWNDYHESILKSWGEQSACYRYASPGVSHVQKITDSTCQSSSEHDHGYCELRPEHLTDVDSAGGSFDHRWTELIAGLIATIMQFLKINELMENHRTAASGMGTRRGTSGSNLPCPERKAEKEGLVVEECKTTYDSLLEQSPPIPKHILSISKGNTPVIPTSLNRDPACAPYRF